MTKSRNRLQRRWAQSRTSRTHVEPSAHTTDEIRSE